MGLALLPALVVLLWRGRDARSLARLAPLLLLPAAVGLYALYLDWAIGDPGRSRAPRPTGTATPRCSARWRGSRTPPSPPAVACATCSTCPQAGQETSSVSDSGTSPT